MKQLQNGVYTFTVGEKDWGIEANKNFEILDNLIKKVHNTDGTCQELADKIQTNTSEINKVNNDFNNKLTSSTTNLQNQIDILNNETIELNYKIDNLSKIENSEHSAFADVATLAYTANLAKKVENPLTIGNIRYDGSKSETISIDSQPVVNSANLVMSGGVYNALEEKQNKATTLSGYNITDAYTKSEIDNIISSNTSNVYSSLEEKQNKATTIKGYNITDAYTKSEVDNIISQVDAYTKSEVDNIISQVDAYTKSEVDNIISQSDASLKEYTDTKVSGLVNSAPETLDTLNELAQALGNDPNFATTTANQIGLKANDNEVVHKAGNETIGGIKTFSNAIRSDLSGTASKAIADSDGNIISETYVKLSSMNSMNYATDADIEALFN